MRRQLAGKRIVITGASSGIGRALALAAGQRGMRVVAAARSVHELDTVVREIEAAGGQAVAVRADVTNPDDRAAIFQSTQEHFGGMDILVNNAGIAAHGHFVDLDPVVLRQIMEVNFFALAENCRLAIPLLAEGEQPLIVNISSMAGRRGVPAWTEYCASKFAVCGFSEALRAELARFEVDLMLVVPGLTASGFGKHLLARKGRLPTAFDKGLPPEIVAHSILRGMERNLYELRVERDARLLLFVNWLAPWYVNWRMKKVVEKLYAPELAERRARRANMPSSAHSHPGSSVPPATPAGVRD